MKPLLRRLNIRPDEERLVLLLFLEVFLLGVGFNFLEASAFPLFLVEFDSQTLPIIYILNALVVAIITAAYLQLGRRTTFANQLIVSLGFLTALIGGFWLALRAGGGRWVVFALPILFQIVVTIGPLGFWSMSNRLLTLRQSKRLIGLIGSGTWVAIVLTGFLMPGIVGLVGTVNLLSLSTLAMVAALALLVFLVREFGAGLRDTGSTAKTGMDSQRSAGALLRNPYIVLMFALTIVSWLAFYFVDNIFYNRVGAQFATEAQLSSFLGLYLAFLGLFTLFNNFVLTGFVINRFGVRAGLLVLPISLLIVTLAISVIGTGWGIVPILFWLATLNKVLDLGFGFSVDQSAQTILYQALPAAERTRIQTIDTGIVRMVAVGAAGVLLLLLNQVFAFDVVQLSYVLLPIILVWLLGVFLTGVAYPKTLLQALERPHLSGLALKLEDPVTVEIVHDALTSTKSTTALVALNLLLANEPETAASTLMVGLNHQAPAVRQEALDRLVEQPIAPALTAKVMEMAAGDTDAVVRGMALRTAALVGGSSASTLLLNALESIEPGVRQGALEGLLRHGDETGKAAAHLALSQLVESPIVRDRVTAARTLRMAGGEEVPNLLHLLADEDLMVRREALRTAGAIHSVEGWPAVVNALADPGTAEIAGLVLTSGGSEALDAVSEVWQREDAARPAETLARIIGRNGAPGAAKLLLLHVDDLSDTMRTAVLEALRETGYRAADPEETALLLDQIDKEISNAAWLLAGLRDCADDPQLDYLRRVLDSRVHLAQTRVILLLSMLYEPESILRVLGSITALSEERRSYALEILDIMLPTQLKTQVMPLMDEQPAEVRLERLGPRYAQTQQATQVRVQSLFAGNGRTDQWLHLAVMHAIGLLACGTPFIEERLQSYAQAMDVLLRETAIATLDHLAAPSAATKIPGMRPMLTTIEKVILLKDVDLFAQMPDELLAEVASLSTEVELSAEQKVFDKGDIGDSLYVVVYGEVRVHDGSFIINYLSDSDVFGEMALLDAEPRMASVTATTETLLLRLEQEPFFDLMESRSEVARGVIRVLSARLRDRVGEVTKLRAESDLRPK